MAVNTQQAVAVGNSAAVKLVSGDSGDFVLLNQGAKTLIVGPAGVTATTGFRVAAAAAFEGSAGTGDEVWGICGGSDTTTVDVWEN